MADPFGFLKKNTLEKKIRIVPVAERITDWQVELQEPLPASENGKNKQSRCMNCGIPLFVIPVLSMAGNGTVSGCPNDNLIPEWNDLVLSRQVSSGF